MLSSFKLPEALAWLREHTGEEWTDSRLFDLCTRHSIVLHAAPPLEARCAVVEMSPDDPSGVRVVMRLGWRKATLYPLHVGQLWQVGETEPVPAWTKTHQEDARRWAVFDPPVRVRREHLAISDKTLQRILHLWRNPSPAMRSREPAGGAQAGPVKWTAARLAEARAMRDKLRASGASDFTKQTAAHFGVSTARLREVLGPDESRAKPAPLVGWPAPKRGRVHRLK